MERKWLFLLFKKTWWYLELTKQNPSNQLLLKYLIKVTNRSSSPTSQLNSLKGEYVLVSSLLFYFSQEVVYFNHLIYRMSNFLLQKNDLCFFQHIKDEKSRPFYIFKLRSQQFLIFFVCVYELSIVIEGFYKVLSGVQFCRYFKGLRHGFIQILNSQNLHLFRRKPKNKGPFLLPIAILEHCDR